MSHILSKGTLLQGGAYRYEIIRTLGQGTFGITYLANAQIPGPLGTVEVPVALKEFFMRDINSRENGIAVTGSTGGFFEDYRRKFRREALNLSHMQHPNIVKVLEMFDANGTSYIAMNYLDGGSLDDYILRHEHLDADEAIKLICPVADALRHMHEAGMLHLDLKPGNIMMTVDGKPVIIDFGLSKQYDEKGNPESSTAVGAGTPGYAPIEQSSYREGSDFPVSMDIYALGATLFKMLTGHRPPDASVIFNDGFPEGDLDKPWITPQLKHCIQKAMAPRRIDRYQTVAEFVDALGGASVVDESTTMAADNEKTDIVASVKPQQKSSPEVKPQQQTASPTPTRKTPPPTAPKKKDLLWLWIFLGVLGVTAVVFVIFLLRGCVGGLADEWDDQNMDSTISTDYFGYENENRDTTIATDYYTDDTPWSSADQAAEQADATEQAIAEAAEEICNCASGDKTKIQECLKSIINTGYAAYKDDKAFTDAVYEKALKCAAEKALMLKCAGKTAVKKAVDKATEKVADEAAKQLMNIKL